MSKNDEKCSKIVNALISKGFVCTISKAELEKTIRQALDISDPRTTKQAIQLLTDRDLLQQTTKQLYKLNIVTAEETLAGKQLSITEALQGIAQ